MKGSAGRLLLVLAAALALLAVRGSLRELGRRVRLAFLLIVTALLVSVAVRAAAGYGMPWTAVAAAVLAPCVALAWRDFLRG